MPAITDEQLVRALRPFVAATGPVLRGLRDADPLRLGRLARRRGVALDEEHGEGPGRHAGPVSLYGDTDGQYVLDSSAPGEVPRKVPERVPQARGDAKPSLPRRVVDVVRRGRGRVLDRLATSKLPGTPRWAVMSPEERDRWWVSRVGRFTSVVASIPGIGGALARRLPVSDIIGLSAQGLVLCAIAGEHGMTGRDEQVRMLASVLFGRDLDPARFGDAHAAEVEREAGELTGELSSDGTRVAEEGERSRLAALARAVWRMGRTLFALHDELDRRPRGRKFWRILANLPVVGAVASYRSERSGLRRAAKQAAAWVAREQGRR